MQTRNLVIRWTVGNVSRRGFEALRLSLWGARKVFGADATYVVCVNSLSVSQARELSGDLPEGIEWRATSAGEIPRFLRPHFDEQLSEGTGWKFAPLRLFPDRYELSLDNDCILWGAPEAIRTWLDGSHADHCVFASDVWQCVGQFSEFCGADPLNSGIRGLPPDFDYEAALRDVLEKHPAELKSEQDEQGLQAAALLLHAPVLRVQTDEVAITSPFPPHLPQMGTCGAHFVGLNAHALPWSQAGRGASDYTAEHWDLWKPAVAERVGVPLEATAESGGARSSLAR